MLDIIIRIAEAVLEELKKKQQNSPLAVAVITAPRKLIQICKTDNSKKISLLSSTENNKTGEIIMWGLIAEAVVVAAVTKAVDSLMED